MYDMPSTEVIQASENVAYLSHFVQDGTFWLLLTYCAGVGGSMLIIGSAAGVVVMGLEKITFVWYLKHFTIIAAVGYFAGIGTFILQSYLF
jgi:Na+/H+ antiporter NhaD/arsenite permease-like protein